MNNEKEKIKKDENDEYLEKIRRLKRKKILLKKKKKRLISDYYWSFIVAFFGIILTIGSCYTVITVITNILGG